MQVNKEYTFSQEELAILEAALTVYYGHLAETRVTIPRSFSVDGSYAIPGSRFCPQVEGLRVRIAKALGDN